MSADSHASPDKAEKTIALMHRAAQANAADRFLQGSLLELPGGGDMLVSGDLHGNLQNLKLLLHRADLRRFRGRHVILQELVHSAELTADGRCLSFQCVEAAARAKLRSPSQVHFVLGNHEMAETLDLAIGKGRLDLNEAFDLGLESAYRDRWREVKDAYRAFWRTVPLAARTPNRIFVAHSTPAASHVEEADLAYLRQLPLGEGLARKSPAYHMLWGRDYSEGTAARFARQVEADLFIVAHSKPGEGFVAPNARHVILDSSAYDGCFVILPLDVSLTQEAVLSRIERINP